MGTIAKSFNLVSISLAGVLGFITESNAAIVSANSCSYADVSTAVTAAAPGDTVTVPAGSCTWNSTLAIDKGISLLGSGIGNTIIANGMTDNFPFLISYNPFDKAANLLFRVSGFTFSLNPTSSGISLSSGNTLILQTKIRVDHNKFFFSSPQGFADNHYLVHAGVKGVVDNNDFGPAWYPMRTPNSPITSPNSTGGGVNEWDNWQGIIFGAADNNLWFEDNTFSIGNTGNGYNITDCQEGGRYAYRYNTIKTSGSGGQLFDMHGNNPPYGWSCMGGEIYGNNITGDGGYQLIDQRGGRTFLFFNNSTTFWNINPREEYDDAGSVVTNPNQYPQHVNGSYYFGNRQGYTGGLFGYYVTQSLNGIPAAGIDFFADNSSPGVSCGTLANRPSTCLAGQGYWATNQSCSDLTGMVGDHPPTPISGTLYRCTSFNTWDGGASPLPYPHPLRGESKTITVLKAPLNLRVVI
ncbi:MAG: hypothetical protein ACXVCP_17765 [Bdellovibrio sp.]